MRYLDLSTPEMDFQLALAAETIGVEAVKVGWRPALMDIFLEVDDQEDQILVIARCESDPEHEIRVEVPIPHAAPEKRAP